MSSCGSGESEPVHVGMMEGQERVNQFSWG